MVDQAASFAAAGFADPPRAVYPDWPGRLDYQRCCLRPGRGTLSGRGSSIEMRTQQIAVRDGAFDTEVWEAGTGNPLLYLHGEGRPTWAPFLDTLAERRQVVAPLHPGYGGSAGTEQLQDLPDLVYYYLDFLD